MIRAGGCQCGTVRYQIKGDPLALYICHCRACQKQSASAFGMSLEVPRSSLTLVQGTPASWSRPTDSGNRLRCLFCPHCGTRLWHEGSSSPNTLTIKAGSLDEPVDASKAIHIWTSRRLAGIVIPPDAQCFPEEPE